jgi:hypothetical protein
LIVEGASASLSLRGTASVDAAALPSSFRRAEREGGEVAPTPHEFARVKDVMRLFRKLGEDTSRFGGG